MGFTTTGIDTSQKRAEMALKKGIDVKHGRIGDFKFPKGYCDAICMFHLLEHLEEPKMFFKTVRAFLKQHGILFIITPNVEPFTNKLYGLKHPNFTQSDHLYFYSKDTLKNILNNQGFEVITMFSKEYAHHFFTSFIGYLKAYLKSNKVNSSSHYIDKLSSEKRTGLQACKSIIRGVIWQSPYLIGTLLYPISWPYRNIVEKTLKGHELIAIARKVSNG